MSDSPDLNDVLAILDVGHGNSAVLFCGEEVIVFDVGLGSSLLEFLTNQDIKLINTIYLSHADEDHIAGMMGILASKTVEIGCVTLNSDACKKSAVWDDLVYELEGAYRTGHINFQVGLTEGHITSFEDVTVTVIGPSRYLASKGAGSVNRSGKKIHSNSISAVIRICKADQPIAILPGDIDSVGLEDLISTGVAADAPILVFPHHGGYQGIGSSIEDYVVKLIELVQPHSVLFSIGRGKYETPNPQLVEELRKYSSITRIMCTQLSEHCTSTIPDNPSDHLCEVFSLGRSKQVCCSGTVLISLNDPSSILPDNDHHIAFIKKYVEKPLCLI